MRRLAELLPAGVIDFDVEINDEEPPREHWTNKKKTPSCSAGGIFREQYRNVDWYTRIYNEYYHPRHQYNDNL